MQNRKFTVIYFFMLSVFFIFIHLKSTFSAESVFMKRPLEEIKKDRFKLFQDKWSEYLVSLTQIKASLIYSRFSKGKLLDEHYTEFESYYPYYSDVRKNARDDYTTVSVVGPQYSFKLHRKNDNEQWAIETVSQNVLQILINDWKCPAPYIKYSEKEIVGYNIYNTLCVGLQTGCSMSLPALLSQDDLVLNKLEYVTIEDKDFLYMDVEYNQKNNVVSDSIDNVLSKSSDEYNYSIHGEIWLDTAYFLIAKARFYETLSSQKITAVITCRYDSISGIPLPIYYKKEGQFKDQDINDEWSIGIDYHPFQKNQNYNSEHFTLSHYGLPEPDFGNSRHSRIRYILLALGGLMILLSLWRIYHKRQINKIGNRSRPEYQDWDNQE